MTTLDHRRFGRRSNCKSACLCGSVTAGVILLTAGVILGVKIFKPKDPIITVDSITFADLDFAVVANRIRPRIKLNVTVDAAITVENPNRVGFAYANSTGILRYRGNDVGRVPIPAGEIGARESRTWRFEMALMADRLLADGDFYSDAISGAVRFQLLVKLPGDVRVVFPIPVVAYARCDLSVHVLSHDVFNQNCHYKAEL